jgi:hypothetical protein
MEPSPPIALVLKVKEIHMCTQWSSATYASKCRNQPPGRSSMGTGCISRLRCFATGHFANKRMKSMINYYIFLSNSMLDCKWRVDCSSESASAHKGLEHTILQWTTATLLQQYRQHCFQ